MPVILHTNDIDTVAIVAPAPVRTPQVAQTPCRGCPAVIHHVGELLVRLCDDCLDEGSQCPCGAEIAGHGGYCSSRCVKRYGRVRSVGDADDDAGASSPVPDDSECTLDHDEDVAPPSPRKLCEGALGAAEAAAEQSSDAAPASAPDVDATLLCATCTNLTGHSCKCRRRCCYGCVSHETGLCPQCDDAVVDEVSHALAMW